MYKDEELYRRKVEEMLRVYREVAHECWYQKDAERKVVMHKASCFFIQPHSAYNVLRQVFYGKSDVIPIRMSNVRRMYEEIYRRVLAMSRKPEYSGMKLIELCEIVVNEEAPEFYISPMSFRTILSRERARMRKEGRKYARR